MKVLILIFFFLTSIFLIKGNAQQVINPTELDSLEKVAFKEEALDIQRRFLESIRSIITSKDSEDSYNAKSYFLTLFFNSNSNIEDYLRFAKPETNKAYEYRELLEYLEKNSNVFNKEFKTSDTLTLERGPKRVFRQSENMDYYPFLIKLDFYEKLLQSKTLKETRGTNPSFNAYERGVLKEITFDVFVNGDEEREIRISNVGVIPDNNFDAKDRIDRIMSQGSEWSSESEEAYSATLNTKQPDVSILAVGEVRDSMSIFLKAYPSGGTWKGNGVGTYNGLFSPLLAYDEVKHGRQVSTISYIYEYDNQVIETSIDIVLSEELGQYFSKVDEQAAVAYIDPNRTPISKLGELGISEKSLRKIEAFRKKCKTFKKASEFYLLLSVDDSIELAGHVYNYDDLKNKLRSILEYNQPSFTYTFDPNDLDSARLVLMNIDPNTIEAYTDRQSEERKIRSFKEFKNIGCFCKYESQIKRWVEFRPENRTMPSLTFSNYIVPGLGHMKFEGQSSRNSRTIRSAAYLGSFVAATSYSVYHKIQSDKWNGRHIDSETFRDAQDNLSIANDHHTKYRIGAAVSAAIFIANITHLKILEVRNKRAIRDDTVPRIGSIDLKLNNDGIGLVYTF